AAARAVRRVGDALRPGEQHQAAQMPRRLILAAFGVLFSALAHAEPPIAAFAPGQLRVAEALLHRAEEALSQHDYKRARVLAAQAGLDARLAYGMSDSSFLRRDAV